MQTHKPHPPVRKQEDATPRMRGSHFNQAPRSSDNSPAPRLTHDLDALTIWPKRPPLDMEVSDEEGSSIQRHARAAGGEAGPRDASPPRRTGGATIPEKIRSRMEHRFNTDLSNVTLHTDSKKASAVDAVAYTQGNQIHFAPGAYNPETGAGMRVLGHELTHVIQQRQGRVRPTSRIKGVPLNDSPALEQEADRIGSMMASGGASDAAPAGQTASTPLPAVATGAAPIQCLRSLDKFKEDTFGNWPRRKSIDKIDIALQAVHDAKADEKLDKLNELRDAIDTYLTSKRTNDAQNARITPVEGLRGEVEGEIKDILFDKLMNKNEAVDQGTLNQEFGWARTPEEQERYKTVTRRRKQIDQTGTIDIGPGKEKLDSPEALGFEDKISRVKDAEATISNAKANYGIDIDSLKGVQAVKGAYSKAPAGVLGGVKQQEWTPRFLNAIDRGLAHYAPILGANRATSTRAGSAQEVTSISRVTHSIDKNTAQGKADTAYGEYFDASKNVSLFNRSNEGQPDFDDLDDQVEGTIIHELAHGLLKYALPGFVAATPYWTDENTKSGVNGAEAPITKYGEKNASEDFSEAVMIFFKDPGRLKRRAPKRHTYIESVVKAWKP